jgi:hypothetical protein
MMQRTPKSFQRRTDRIRRAPIRCSYAIVYGMHAEIVWQSGKYLRYNPAAFDFAVFSNSRDNSVTCLKKFCDDLSAYLTKRNRVTPWKQEQ